MASLTSFCNSFRKMVDKQMGVELVQLLERGAPAPEELQREKRVQEATTSHGGDAGEVLALFLLSLRAKHTGDSVKELELICTTLKTWVHRYVDADGSALWMTPLIMHLSILARRVASHLDQAKRSEAGSDAFLKKLVEIYRDMFQKLNKEKAKRAGLVWVSCEMARAYFLLGQITQCDPLFKNMSQYCGKDNFNPETDLPKAICVTFYFYWGKFCVFAHALVEADRKLSWAFQNCPPKYKSNRRKILLYLVPCKLRLGVLPTQELLQSHDLGMFVDIVKAIREGNVRLFSEKMEENAADFIKMGTYLLMMKLKFTVLRNLCKGVYREVSRKPGGDASKLDLKPFEHIFAWQADCDADETACVLASLIYQNAIKGYLSHERKKLVLSKGEAFPAPSKWKS